MLSRFFQSFNTRQQKRIKRQSLESALTVLEPRLLLAGDVGNAMVASLAAPAISNDAAAATDATAGRTAVETIVFIDADVKDISEIAGEIGDAEVVLLDAKRSGIEQITELLSQRRDVSSVQLISHGSAGQLFLSGQIIDAAVIQRQAAEIASWSIALKDQADILLLGCEVGATSNGTLLLNELARLTGADVAASTNRTGKGGDWILENKVGEIETSLALDPAFLAAYQSALPISIQAAGDTGTEQMQLQIDGVTVQTWNNVGGNASARQFQTYTYDGGAGVTGDRVGIVFSNDQYNPGVIDRNLRVDSVTVNGTTIQTEDARVFSSGSWQASDGIQPGYRTNEYLSSNGYFGYFNPSNPGSLIKIHAAGTTHQETMQLQLNGQVVNTWYNVGGNADAGQFLDYFYYSPYSTITPDQVRIAFTNDFYQLGGIDRNLRIDWVNIDGTQYETESPSVYSTGTWDPSSNSITAGNRQSENLNSNGYFQYANSNSNTGGVSRFSIASSQITVNESDAQATIQVIRTGDLNSTATIDYETFDQSAVSGQDYQHLAGTLTFAPNQTSQSVNVSLINDTNAETNESFSLTIDNPSGSDLGAPRTATIEIVDNDSSLPSYANFAGATGLKLNGSASLTNNNLQLTSVNPYQAGSAFYQTPILVDANTSFQTAFSFAMVGGYGANGADGIALVLQNSATGTSALGRYAWGLGYDTINKSVGILLDTWKNPWDKYSDQVAVVVNGNVQTPLTTAQSPINLNFGGTYFAWVDYNGTSDSLSVYISEDNQKPTAAVIKATVRLNEVVGNQMYIGFSAADYDRANSHQIMSWSMNLQPPAAEPPVNPSGNIQGQLVYSGLVQPTAIDWSPDGNNTYIAQKNGIVRVARNGSLLATPVIDISSQVNDIYDRGLLDIAINPDLNNNPYLYLLYTYDPPEVYNNVGNTLAGPDQGGNRAGRLMRVTLDASTNYTTIVSGSEKILLGTNSTWSNFNAFTNSVFDKAEKPAGTNPDGSYLRDFINSDSTTHTVASLEFANDGSLFVSIGDGASYNDVDPRNTRVQDIDSLSGKVLRIDPITGQGLSNNPFYNGDPNSNRAKVYQLGLRNPFRITVDNVTGRLFVGDVGWTTWEEINTASAGANFGWPYYEGGSGQNFQTGGGYANLAKAQAFYASGQTVVPSILALNHYTDGIDAIVLGDVIRSDAYGQQYKGDILFNSLGQGIVRHASIDASGAVTSVDTFATGANYYVDMRQGPDGTIYYVDLLGGKVGHWVLV